MGRILVVDDEVGLRDALEVLLLSRGHAVQTAQSVQDAKSIIEKEHLDLVITDLRLGPTGDGIDVVRAARSSTKPHMERPEVIVMTAFGTREKAREAIEVGASFYLEKGVHLATDVDVLCTQAIVKRQLEVDNLLLRERLFKESSFQGIIGQSQAMREVMDLVKRLAPIDATILITGESGTGKERIARALHQESLRREGPFVALNCGALPEALIESELFGHKKGSFTGANEDKEGIFASAKGGTVFLDEIGELPIALQPKLLRVLQEKKIRPIGANMEVPFDARLIAATNRRLEHEVKEGRFREDLYFRLKVFPIELPPLRERREDIPLLTHAFLKSFSTQYKKPAERMTTEALECLMNYRFPGNVRELQNLMERLVALGDSVEIEMSSLPEYVQIGDLENSADKVEGTRLVNTERFKIEDGFPQEGVNMDRLVEHFERELMEKALEQAGGVKTKAAELLGISFRQFRYKFSKVERRGKPI